MLQPLDHRLFCLDRVAVDIAADGEKAKSGIDFLCEIALLVNAADMPVALRIGRTVAPVH